MAEIIDLDAILNPTDQPHFTSWVTCKGCGYVFTSVRPADTNLDDIECGECGWRGVHVVWNRHALREHCSPEFQRSWLEAVPHENREKDQNNEHTEND